MIVLARRHKDTKRDTEFVEIGRKCQSGTREAVIDLTGLKLGYLLNFGAAVMKDGIYRIINGEIE